MLHKLNHKPVWYKIWALSVAAVALFCLVKYFFFSFTPTDHLIQAYALVSIVLDMFLYPKNS